MQIKWIDRMTGRLLMAMALIFGVAATPVRSYAQG